MESEIEKKSVMNMLETAENQTKRRKPYHSLHKCFGGDADIGLD